MYKMPIGLYEKALPDELSWEERLTAAGQAGYDFVEISIDESRERLSQLNWSKGLCRFERLFRRWCKQTFWRLIGVEIWGSMHTTGEDPVASVAAARKFVDGLVNEA